MSPRRPNVLLDAARRLVLAGLSVIPVEPKTKRAALSEWKPYQARRATEEELRTWFPKATALALICGAVSGNAEVIDFDQKAEVYDRWAEMAEAEAPGLVARLYRQRSQSGGRHVLYRCAGPVPGNTKLARRPREDKEPLVLVETRGEGGEASWYCYQPFGFAGRRSHWSCSETAPGRRGVATGGRARLSGGRRFRSARHFSTACRITTAAASRLSTSSSTRTSCTRTLTFETLRAIRSAMASFR
jgi:hypothetical protein